MPEDINPPQPPASPWQRALQLAAGVAVLATAAMTRGAGRALASDTHAPGYPQVAAVMDSPSSAAAQQELLPHEHMAIKLFEQNLPCVVNITHIRSMQNFHTLDIHRIPYGQGSGFIWDRQGHIITNYHVIKGASEVKVGVR